MNFNPKLQGAQDLMQFQVARANQRCVFSLGGFPDFDPVFSLGSTLLVWSFVLVSWGTVLGITSFLDPTV